MSKRRSTWTLKNGLYERQISLKHTPLLNGLIIQTITHTITDINHTINIWKSYCSHTHLRSGKLWHGDWANSPGNSWITPTKVSAWTALGRCVYNSSRWTLNTGHLPEAYLRGCPTDMNDVGNWYEKFDDLNRQIENKKKHRSSPLFDEQWHTQKRALWQRFLALIGMSKKRSTWTLKNGLYER